MNVDLEPDLGLQQVAVGRAGLAGELSASAGAIGLVVFVHGSGSSRLSPRNRFVAAALRRHRLAVLLFDLLTPAEADDRDKVFDIDLLASRLEDALDWLRRRAETAALRIGLFGASTGAAAALQAAAEQPGRVAAVVSRGGRPDLARRYLPQVEAPTLLIVGGLDREVLELNRAALQQLHCNKRLEIVPGASHLFEQAGALEAVADLAGTWFQNQLGRRLLT